ncbi:phenylacetic acid degradation protein [Hazenella coriacea]|uniref:Ring-1,2-phenylacetyl-CoA epoxidase subunit PaaB n=1 Tax=Hazenella coriacea TaxID=1179467 RepID=A0A4R3LC60_9BACL|nr:phenylacetic acid degradation protein [Hazenella coriacea]TCS96850.1 ring-1,2-phenylacetyl-CoA epoxidase subunit PaaB [Hazenella coriacea]
MEEFHGEQIFEVFIQRSSTEHHTHVGSLLSPSADLAILLARENFLRRENAISVWVVPRSQVTETSNPDELSKEMDKSYREVRGYTENGRLWRMFKEKAISLEEIVAYVEGKEKANRM